MIEVCSNGALCKQKRIIMSHLSTGVILSAANKGLFVLYLHIQFHIRTEI